MAISFLRCSTLSATREYIPMETYLRQGLQESRHIVPVYLIQFQFGAVGQLPDAAGRNGIRPVCVRMKRIEVVFPVPPVRPEDKGGKTYRQSQYAGNVLHFVLFQAAESQGEIMF
jgi:hypothetical protein